MTMRWFRESKWAGAWLLILSAALLLSAVAGDSFAADNKGKKKEEPAPPPEPPKPVWPSPLDPGLFDGVFKELPFGSVREQFLLVFHTRMETQLAPMLKATLDPAARDTLKDRMEKAFTDVSESYVELLGAKAAGYSVSVIEKEYVANVGEALHKFAYGENTSYFFFSGDQMWKLFICAQTEGDFASLLVKLASLYGDPKDIQYEDQEKTVPIHAAWKDTTFELSALPPKGIFVCSRLIWTYLPTAVEVEKRRAEAAKGAGESTDSEKLLQMVTEEPVKQDPDILDKILDQKK
jgi:hypothetical protein